MRTRRCSGQRWRVLSQVVAIALSLGAAWLVLLVHPALLFAHSLRVGTLVLHAQAPLPPESRPLLAEVERRISASPLFDRGRRYHIFSCDSRWLFAFLTPGSRGSGVTNPWGNVFIHSPDIVHDRVRGRNGEIKAGERTLTYFVAHEVTHSMTFANIGWWRSRRLAAFQREGYADYIGFSHHLDLAVAREALRHAEPEMDPSRSGLYKRYELLVAYLLERRAMPVTTLFARRLDQHAIERDLDAARDL
jgi:hypothetical protein